MTFKEYQKLSKKTAIYPVVKKGFVYPVLGLSGEAGEVAEKVKKILRDKAGRVTDRDRKEIQKELGDVLWYLSQVATEFNLSLEEIAKVNLKKLYSRKKRGTLHGRGDNR